MAGATVPGDLVRHDDPSGFSISVPAGWTAQRKGSAVWFRDPANPRGRYLQVDQTDEPKPDVLADWQAQEASYPSRFDQYQRISLGRVDVPYAQQAADLEFRHGRASHVLSRNLITSPTQAYALYFTAPHASWPAERQLFDTLAAGFDPAG